MGKLQSKHVCHNRENTEGQCFLVNAHFSSFKPGATPTAQILWKAKDSGLGIGDENTEYSFFANKNAQDMGEEDALPLTVNLPPEKILNSTAQVLAIDQTESTVNAKINPAVNVQVKSAVNEEKDTKLKDSKTEEFECGITMEGDKQEWSFTLYDMDPRGKITKDELAGLIKSLYDAVGSSIPVPETGSKSMKLKLTVTPDNTHVVPKNQSDVNQSRPSKHSHTINDLSQKPPVKEVKINNLAQAMEKLRLEKTPTCTVGNQDNRDKKIKCQDKADPRSSSAHHHHKKQTLGGTTDSRARYNQQELVELVKMNMERHQRKQQLRRHNSDGRRHVTAARRYRQQQANKDESPCQENMDRRNYYLDLAGVENHNSTLLDTSGEATNNNTALLMNTSAPAVMPNTCTAEPNNLYMQDNRLTSDSRKSKKCDNKTENTPHSAEVATECLAARARSLDRNSPPRVPRRSPRKLPLPKTKQRLHHSAPGRGTGWPPRHSRHSSRDKHDNMHQVEQWLNDSPQPDCDHGDVVQRHEHHHKHEHHHHYHYHHYPVFGGNHSNQL